MCKYVPVYKPLRRARQHCNINITTFSKQKQIFMWSTNSLRCLIYVLQTLKCINAIRRAWRMERDKRAGVATARGKMHTALFLFVAAVHRRCSYLPSHFTLSHFPLLSTFLCTVLFSCNRWVSLMRFYKKWLHTFHVNNFCFLCSVYFYSRRLVGSPLWLLTLA